MRLRFICLTLAASALLSCEEGELKEPLFDGRNVTFVAVTEETRVALTDDLTQIVWEEGDSISVLDGFSNVAYVASEGGRKTKFTSGTGISDETSDVYAVYPFNTDVVRLDDGVKVCLPSVQKVDTTMFDPAASMSVAYTSRLKAETELKFENICSYFKFSVPSEDKIVQVVLRGGKGEWLAGEVNAVFKNGDLNPEVVEGENKIIFEAASPMAGTYLIPLLPCVLQDGLSVSLKNSEGRSATHKVVAKNDEGNVSAAVFERNKINKFALSFKESVWKDAPDVKPMGVSATTATFAWSENGFTDPASDFAVPYRVELYSDVDCKNLVQGWDWEMAQVKNVSCPAFCFCGLDPQTDYWFTVTNDLTNSTSLPEKVTTSADDFVTVNGVAEEGQVALRENFSELASGADPLNVAWGVLDGAITSAPGTLGVWSEADFSGTRLAEWQEKTPGANYVGAGYVRVGDSASQKDALYTPVLSNLKECATVEISFKAAPYSSDFGVAGGSNYGECYAEVWVVNGTEEISAGVVELVDDPQGWTSCSLEVYNVLPTSRIAIGGAFGEKSKAPNGKQYGRIYLDDILVKVVKYEKFHAIKPKVKEEKTFWSDSRISWTCSGEPDGYKVYVNGTAVTEVLGKTVNEYHITGLPVGTASEITVAAMYGDKEAVSDPKSVTTGAITQLTKNLSPTSVSVSIENKAGKNDGNNNPCLYVELLDSSDPATAKKIYSTYVLDAQIQSPASPFMVSYAVNGSKERIPTNVAFGGLEPGKDYWFRVKSVERYDFTSNIKHKEDGIEKYETYCASSNGDSEFSEPVKVSTPALHAAEADEILYQGFDDLMVQGDFINCAVGSVPAFLNAGKKVGDMNLETIRNWEGELSFYGLRVAFASSQLAAHYAWATQLKQSGDLFKLKSQDANGTIIGAAPAVGAKVYRFDKFDSCLSGWYTSNNTFACQGYILLGAYFNVSDGGFNKQRGMIATPELDSHLLSDVPKDCTLSFKGFVIQGRSTQLQVWVYDSSAKTWSEVTKIPIHNSTGTSEPALECEAKKDENGKTTYVFNVLKEYDARSDTHRWYDYTYDLSLKNGDVVALVAETEDGATLIDDITITTK